MSIRIYYDKINFRVHRSGEIKKFLEKVITDENKAAGDLKIIFTSDEILLDINRKFLSHDYYTDVISFNYTESESITGEIYISAEALKRNAGIYKVAVYEETWRIMIHGVLHLCGYNDGNERDKKIMITMQEEKVREFVGNN